MIYRLLNRKLKDRYTCEELLDILRGTNFADIEGQGYIPLYSRKKIIDDLYEACGFRTNYQFISKRSMKKIQKKVMEEKKYHIVRNEQKSLQPSKYRSYSDFILFQLSKTGLYQISGLCQTE